MKKHLTRVVFALVAVVCFSTALSSAYSQTVSPSAQHTQAPKPRFVEGEFMVQFKNTRTTQAQALAALKSVNPQSARRIGDGLYLVTVDKSADIPKVVGLVNKLAGVQFAEPNYIYSLS